MELNTMNMKHTLDEVKMEKEQSMTKAQNLKEQLETKEKEFIKLKNDIMVAKVGI